VAYNTGIKKSVFTAVEQRCFKSAEMLKNARNGQMT